MKFEQIYQSLKEIAEKLEIKVFEHNFRTAGIKVTSGFCTVEGEKRFIIDKHKRIREKTKILASYLATQSIEDIYIIPLVREYIDKFRD